MADFKYNEYRKKSRSSAPSKIRPLSTLLDHARAELDQAWLSTHIQLVERKPWTVVCLGLGSPSSSQIARTQLVFLLDLCDALSIPPERITAYDPVFTDTDREYLTKTLHWTVPTSDPINSSSRSSEENTLWYMPHCDLELYDAVLKANWEDSKLQKLTFISNQFSHYVENNSRRDLERKAPHVLHLAPHFECYLFSPCPSAPTAFNNIAVQFLNSVSSTTVVAS